MIHALLQAVPPQARVLCLSSEERAYLSARGSRAEPPPHAPDPRLLSLAPESFDAISYGDALTEFTLTDHQRMLAIAFRALRPARGILLLACSTDVTEEAYGSLLRQNGFTPIGGGLEASRRWVLARRA
jgi:hypothetical protein